MTVADIIERLRTLPQGDPAYLHQAHIDAWIEEPLRPDLDAAAKAIDDHRWDDARAAIARVEALAGPDYHDVVRDRTLLALLET